MLLEMDLYIYQDCLLVSTIFNICLIKVFQYLDVYLLNVTADPRNVNKNGGV